MRFTNISEVSIRCTWAHTSTELSTHPSWPCGNIPWLQGRDQLDEVCQRNAHGLEVNENFDIRSALLGAVLEVQIRPFRCGHLHQSVVISEATPQQLMSAIRERRLSNAALYARRAQLLRVKLQDGNNRVLNHGTVHNQCSPMP